MTSEPMPPRGPEPIAKAVSPHRVLVVDDNDATRTLVSLILRQDLGIQAALAADAAEAQRLLDTERFDVILLDLLMPGSNGFDVLGWIRSSSRHNREASVIVVSVLGDDESVRRCRALGATFHVVKPIMRDSLVGVVREHLPAVPGGGPAGVGVGGEAAPR